MLHATKSVQFWLYQTVQIVIFQMPREKLGMVMEVNSFLYME